MEDYKKKMNRKISIIVWGSLLLLIFIAVGLIIFLPSPSEQIYDSLDKDIEISALEKQQAVIPIDRGYDYPNFDIINDTTNKTLIGLDLIKNTEQCLIDCYAIINITLYQPTKLFTELDFVDKKDKKKFLDYNIYYEKIGLEDVDVPIYNTTCNHVDLGNGTEYDNCTDTIIGYDTIEVPIADWHKYKGEEMPIGDYLFKLEAKKEYNKSVDWAFEIPNYITQDEVRNMWAWWNSSWSKKQNITGINGSISYINITYDLNMQTDFDDIRFLNEAQDTELSYFLQDKVDSTWATFRINTSTETTIVMYYDNPIVSSNSDITDVYGSGIISANFMDKQVGNFTDSTGNYTTVRTNVVAGIDGIIAYSGNFTPLSSVEYNDKVTPLGTKSVSVWFKTDNISGMIYSNQASVSQYGIFIRIGGSGEINTRLAQGTQKWDFSSINTYNDSLWHHVVLTWDGTTNANAVKHYIDGNTTPETTTSTSIETTPPTSNLYLGIAWNGVNQFDGLIDEVIVWNKVLTSSQALEIYNSNKPNVSFQSEEFNIIQIDLISPINNSNLSDAQTNFTCNANHPNGINNLTLILDGVNNYTITNSTPSENLNLSVLKNISDGNHNWSCNAQNDVSNVNSSVRTYLVDTIFPQIIITSPMGTYYFPEIATSLDLNWTIIDANTNSCWYFYNASNVSVNCSDNATTFEPSPIDSNLTFYANDTTGNENSSSINWNYVFTLWNQTNLGTDLVSYYKLDEKSGTNIYDSLYINDGTSSGAVPNQTGKIETAWTFDGIDDYISMNDKVTPQGTKSISVWFKTNDTNGIIYSNQQFVAEYGIFIRIDSSSEINTRFVQGSSKWDFYSVGTNYSNNEWHHLVLTWNGTTDADAVRHYIDGNAPETATSTSTETTPPTSNLYLGRGYGGINPFNGTIDEVGIWDRVLNDTEAGYLYGFGFGIEMEYLNLITTPPNNTFTNISITNFTINANNTQGIDNVTLFILNESDVIINQTTIDTGGSTNILLGIIYYLWYEGIYKWYFEIVDTLNNLVTTTESIITYDITEPSGAILYPLNTTYTYSITEMNISIIEVNPNNCWYNINGINVSETCGVNITGISSTEGINTWYYWINDSVGYINESSVIFTQDTIAPNITIYSPIIKTYTESEFLVNISTDDPLAYVWYSYDYGTTNTTYISETIEDVIDGTYNLTLYVWANDSVNNIETAQVNFAIDVETPIVILNPINNYSTNNLTSSFNITYNITDAGNLTSCWYIVDGNWFEDEFNNSLTEENLTFISEGNMTRWLEIPENSSNLISAYMNLSGFEYSIYKATGDPFATVSLGITYNRSGIEFNITQVKIDNITFRMAEETNPAGNIFVTFRNITDDSLIYQKDFGTVLSIIPENYGNVNFNINDSPLIEEPIYILIERNVSEVDAVRWVSGLQNDQDALDYIRSVRYNGSLYSFAGYSYNDDPPMTIAYEEGYGYVNNASISIDGTEIWSYVDKFNQTNNRTSDFDSTINSYLSGCPIINGSCFVPFTFHSDTAGILRYSDLLFTDGISDNLDCSANNETITIYSDGFHELTIYGEDTGGLIGNDSDDFYILYHEYTQPVSETTVAEGEVIEFNLTIEVTDITRVTDMTAVLVYDGTDYAIDSFAILDDGYFFERDLAIPNGIGNTTGRDINWSWRYSIEGNSYWVENFSTTNQTQTVFSVEIDNCSIYNETILNLYKLNDEETDTLMNETLNPQIEVDLSLISLGNSSLIWNFHTIFENSTSGAICIPNYLLNYSDYRIDIVLGYIGDTYVQEFWYLDAGTISENTTTLDDYTSRNITLRDLLLVDSTTFLFKYHDESFKIHPNAIVSVLRYYIGEGIFKEVERCKLDNNGECHLHLVEEDVIYKFRVTDNGVLEFESEDYNAKCVNLPCSITLAEGVIIPEPETEFDRLAEGTYNIDSEAINRTVTLSFSLASTGTMDLEVYVYDNDGTDDTLIISDSATAKAGEVIVSVPISYENNTYYAIVRHNGEFVTSEWIDMSEKGFIYFGALGLFLAVLLILTLGLIAVTSGAWTIVFIILGLIVSMITRLIDMGYYSLIWIICLGILIIYKLSNRGGS